MVRTIHGPPRDRVIFMLNIIFLLINVVLWFGYRPDHTPVTSTVHDSPCRNDVRAASAAGEESSRKNVAWNYSWDGRQPVDKGERPTARRHLYLIRHGQYHMKTEPKGRLTEQGILQAEAVGKHLKNLNIRFDRYVVSTSKRAVHTAQIVHKYVPYLQPEYTALLKEGSPNYPAFAPDTWDPKHKVFKEDGDRFDKAFRNYMHRAPISQKLNSNELFVVHGNVISYMVLRALQLPEDAWLRVSVFQASITRLDILPNGQVYLKILGDVGHLASKNWTDR